MLTSPGSRRKDVRVKRSSASGLDDHDRVSDVTLAQGYSVPRTIEAVGRPGSHQLELDDSLPAIQFES